MAYALRYFYEQKHEDGKVIRLEIHKRNATAAAMEIGDVVQGLSLNIEGGEDNIDTPVVTSSLVMTFVDAYDHPEADTKKCGNWAEFYTPDATLWKIIVKAKDSGASFRTIWGGYVTPDSYEESLVYGGSVTITARDNIGHMSDFLFDAEGDSYGTISLRELVEAAWAKIESPMELAWGSTWLECEGVSAPDTRMNVAAFAEKNWREAVEMALYGYGAVLRYIGENKVIICPLEGIPSFGANDIERTDPIFMAGATRMLTPALKRIEESVSYDLVSDLQPLVKQEDFSGNSHVLDSDNNIRGFSLSNTQEGKGWLNTIDYTAIYFDASNYAISGVDASERNEIKRQMYVVANRPFSEFTEYSRYMSAQNVTIKVQFGTGLMRNVRENYLTPKAGKITSVCCRVSVTQNGIKQYYDVSREWKTTSVYQTIAEEAGLTEINVPVDMSEYSGEVLIKVELGGIDATIPFVQIQSFSFETFGEDTYLATNRVNTNYDENNNVIITRDPAIAPAYNKTFLPSVIKNGIYVQSGYTYLPASAWSWKGQSAQQMAVFNHLQLICYYAKPNNILEGNIVNADVTRFAQIWDWEGKEHILVAGRFNFLSGYIEGAILREFARYDDMWANLPSTQLPATEQTSVSNIEAAASGGSSSNASTYTNNTTVYIGSGSGGSGASSLGELSDVDVAGVIGGSVLYFNGTEWVDKPSSVLLEELLKTSAYLKSLWSIDAATGELVTEKQVRIKNNLVAEKQVSAGGKASSGSGTDSSSGVILLNDWNKFNASLPQALAAILGKDLHERLLTIEAGGIKPEGYATTQYVDNAISDLINGAPSAYDTLGKIAEALQGNIEAIELIREQIGGDKIDVKAIEARLAEAEKITKRFGIDENDNTYTDKNFYSTMQLSAGGMGTQGGNNNGGSKMYVFSQGVPSALWKIKHQLGKMPNVKIVEDGGGLVYGDVQYKDTEEVWVKFGAPFSGTAYLD